MEEFSFISTHFILIEWERKKSITVNKKQKENKKIYFIR